MEAPVDLFVRNATDKRIASIFLRPKPGATLELAAGTERLLVVDYTRDAAALSSTPIATVLARGVSGDAADQARARSKVDDFARYLRERAKVAVLAAQRVGGSAIAGGPRVVLLASSTELLVAVIGSDAAASAAAAAPISSPSSYANLATAAGEGAEPNAKRPRGDAASSRFVAAPPAASAAASLSAAAAAHHRAPHGMPGALPDGTSLPLPSSGARAAATAKTASTSGGCNSNDVREGVPPLPPGWKAKVVGAPGPLLLHPQGEKHASVGAAGDRTLGTAASSGHTASGERCHGGRRAVAGRRSAAATAAGGLAAAGRSAATASWLRQVWRRLRRIRRNRRRPREQWWT